jgi:hypothetical protein
MCYADGPNPDPAAVYTNTACPAIAGSAGLTQTYDCHGDDYFNPSPPAGNYLATHWNLYNSIFEASCATIGDACGADSAAVPAGVAAPRLTGTAKVNNVLTADRGTWSGTPTSFAYQWQRTLSGGSTTDIPGATDATYTLTPADAQAQIQAKVTATNTNGSASNTSSQTTIAAYNPPVNTAPPAITGTARRGRVLTASTGGWTGSTSKGFKWQRLVGATWTDIAGQTGSTYTLASADVDTSVRVLETATNADGPASAASNAIGPVSPALPIVQTAPGISGTVQRTRTLTASNGTWSDAPTAYGYQWQRDGVDIGGATAQTYVPVQNDVGATLRVLVTATNADGDSAPAASAQTAAVADLQPPVGSTQPAITGEPTNTHALSADHGTWSNSPTSYAYQWQRDSGAGFGNIQDATQAGYVLTAEDVEALVRVRIVATNGDGDSAAAYSAPVGPVADVPVPVNGARPQVSGTSKAGHSVTATSGDWTHDPTSFAFQWQRSTGGAVDDIGGATGTTYALGLSDVGHSVRVVVVASNADGDSAPAESDPTAAVAAADPVQLPPIAPVIAPVDLTPVGPGDLPTVPVAPADVYKSVKVSLKRGKRTTLKLTVTSRTSRTGLVATIPSKWVKVAKRGTYRLTLCANVVCVSKPFRAARGKAKLPAIVAASQIPGRVTLRLIGPGGRATGKLP